MQARQRASEGEGSGPSEEEASPAPRARSRGRVAVSRTAEGGVTERERATVDACVDRGCVDGSERVGGERRRRPSGGEEERGGVIATHRFACLPSRLRSADVSTVSGVVSWERHTWARPKTRRGWRTAAVNVRLSRE